MKNVDIKKFWNFVELIQWVPSEHNAKDIKKALLKDISPQQAEQYRKICIDLAKKLLSNTSMDDSTALSIASNAVGYGEKVYNEASTSTSLMSAIYEESVLNNCFIDVIPTYDDYFIGADFVDY